MTGEVRPIAGDTEQRQGPSAGPAFRPSVRLFVCPSARLPVCPSVDRCVRTDGAVFLAAAVAGCSSAAGRSAGVYRL